MEQKKNQLKKLMKTKLKLNHLYKEKWGTKCMKINKNN